MGSVPLTWTSKTLPCNEVSLDAQFEWLKRTYLGLSVLIENAREESARRDGFATLLVVALDNGVFAAEHELESVALLSFNCLGVELETTMANLDHDGLGASNSSQSSEGSSSELHCGYVIGVCCFGLRLCEAW